MPYRVAAGAKRTDISKVRRMSIVPLVIKFLLSSVFSPKLLFVILPSQVPESPRKIIYRRQPSCAAWISAPSSWLTNQPTASVNVLVELQN
jgi:hypothetical protein